MHAIPSSDQTSQVECACMCMFAELTVQVLACGSSVCFLLFTMSTPWQDRQWGCASWNREWWDHGWWDREWCDHGWQLESEQQGDATERSVDLHHAVAAHPAVTAPSPPTNIAGQSSVRIDADEVPQGAATEHSVDLHHAGTERLAAAERSPQGNAASGSCATAGGGMLSCPVCQRAICQTRDLAFFHRHNPQGGTEVHLMLKPEREVPPTLVPAEEPDKGATRTWNCVCGAKLGDTRQVGFRKAAMTAFKSASVLLCGRHLPGKKSKWPTVYNQPPYDHIEVRTRATYYGTSRKL